jgi:hypothetical protein
MKAYRLETIDQTFENGLLKDRESYDYAYFFNRNEAYKEARNRLMEQINWLKNNNVTQYEINKLSYRPSKYCRIIFKDVKDPEFEDEIYTIRYHVSEIDIVE